MEKLKDIDTFYSQKVIPLAFNESLSYMEQICALIDYIENTIVPTLNEHTDAINNLQAYVKMLKDLLDKLDKKVDDNFTTLNTKINTTKEELNTKIDTTKEELNTKIDTTKEELNTKIDTTKEELTNIINGINETLTNSINDLDTKVINHINESNERFNNINTQIGSINNNIETINTNIGTINTQIESINTSVTQNTNDIVDLKLYKAKLKLLFTAPRPIVTNTNLVKIQYITNEDIEGFSQNISKVYTNDNNTIVSFILRNISFEITYMREGESANAYIEFFTISSLIFKPQNDVINSILVQNIDTKEIETWDVKIVNGKVRAFPKHSTIFTGRYKILTTNLLIFNDGE